MPGLHSVFITKSVRQHEVGLIAGSDLSVLFQIQILGYIYVCVYTVT